jgi:SAM-dependent methyltransferase
MALAQLRRKDNVEAGPSGARDSAKNECPACGCRIRRRLFAVGGYRYVECPGCGLAHLDPVPLEHEVRAIFDESYFTGGLSGGYDDYTADEGLHRENARLRLDMLDNVGIVPPGRLLDVGCAHGFFLDEARGSGWGVRGVDVSSTAASYASTCFGLDVASDLTVASRDDPYDVVTFFQVLEHVASPLEVLEQARDSLAERGTLMIETWDRGSMIPRLMRSQWQVVAPPSVVWLWDRCSLAFLLASAGFRITSARRSAKRVSLRFVTSLLDQNRGPLGCICRLVEGTPLCERSFRYHLGDLITITAAPSVTRDGRPEWSSTRRIR